LRYGFGRPSAIQLPGGRLPFSESLSSRRRSLHRDRRIGASLRNRAGIPMRCRCPGRQLHAPSADNRGNAHPADFRMHNQPAVGRDDRLMPSHRSAADRNGFLHDRRGERDIPAERRRCRARKLSWAPACMSLTPSKCPAACTSSKRCSNTKRVDLATARLTAETARLAGLRMRQAEL